MTEVTLCKKCGMPVNYVIDGIMQSYCWEHHPSNQKQPKPSTQEKVEYEPVKKSHVLIENNPIMLASDVIITSCQRSYYKGITEGRQQALKEVEDKINKIIDGGGK